MSLEEFVRIVERVLRVIGTTVTLYKLLSKYWRWLARQEGVDPNPP